MRDDPQVEPDVLVRTALQLLPVPDHGPDFWVDLERRLAGEASPAEGPTTAVRAAAAAEAVTAAPALLPPQPAGSRSVLPPELRRRSNAVLAVAAVAAAVLVVVAGSALLRQRSGGDARTTELAGTTPTTPVPTDSARRALGTTLPEVSADVGDESTAMVMRWVGALGAGDADAAWASLGPASRDHLGGRAGLDDLMSELGEGYGAWAAATPEEVLVTPVGAAADAQVVVVTLLGDVEHDGRVERRSDAFVVLLVASAGDHHLEPFDTAGTIELVDPEVPASDGAAPRLEGDELVIVVPDGVEAPVIRLDDGEPLVCGASPGTELTALEGSTGQRCAVSPAGGIEPGEHHLTVAVMALDASGVSAEAVRFRAA